MQIGISSFQATDSYAQVQAGGNTSTASAADAAQTRVAFSIPVQTVQAPRPAESSDKAVFAAKKDDSPAARDDRKAREADGKPGRLLDIFA